MSTYRKPYTVVMNSPLLPPSSPLLSPPSSPPRLRTSPSLFFLPPAPLLSELWCFIAVTWKMRRTLSAQTTCLRAKLHTAPRRAHTLTLFLSLSLSTAACECTPGPRVHARWATPTSRARARGKNQVGKSRARPAGAVTARLAELQFRVTPGAALDRAAT